MLHDWRLGSIVRLAAKNVLHRSLNMKTFRVGRAVAVIVFFTVPSVVAQNQSRSASSAPRQSLSSSATTTTVPSEAQSGTNRIITAYLLPPELHKKAHDLNRIRFRQALIAFVYGIVVLW